jgi:hypothetical protein
MNVKKPIQYPPAIILYGNLDYDLDAGAPIHGSIIALKVAFWIMLVAVDVPVHPPVYHQRSAATRS